MSAEVVLNEVWTEDRSPLYPPPLCLIPPASDRKRHTEWQRRMACSKLAGVGEKAMAELIGENGSFFPLSRHPSSCDHSQIPSHSLWTALLRFFFFLSWCTSVGCCGVYMYRNVCVQHARMRPIFVWSKAGQAGCVASPGAKKACPLPLIITRHIIIILLLNTRQLCSCISMCVCLWMHVFVCMPPRDPRRAAHQQRALDLDEGQHCRSQ